MYAKVIGKYIILRKCTYLPFICKSLTDSLGVDKTRFLENQMICRSINKVR